MPLDGSTWDETNPTNSTLAVLIDDYFRDERIAIRSRLSFEHEWPSSQSATNQAGQHKFITMQNQAAKPTVSGTQIAAVYTKTIGAGLQELFFEDEAANEIQLTSGNFVNANVVKSTIFSTSGLITCTNAIPPDDTPPLFAEGDLVLAGTYTPTPGGSAAGTKLLIEANGMYSANAAGHFVTFISVNSSTSIGVSSDYQGAANQKGDFYVRAVYTITTSAAHVIQLMGAKGSGDAITAIYVNGVTGGRIYGGEAITFVTVKEVNGV